MDFTLTGIDIASVLPFTTAVVFGIVVLMLEAFQRQSFSRSYLGYVTAVGFAATAFAAWFVSGGEGAATFSGTAYLDGFSNAITWALCFGGAMTALMATEYLEEQHAGRGEAYALLLFAVSGMIMMVQAADLLTFFVGLEIQSVAVYALAAFTRRSTKSAEAGLKYFILGAMASAFFVFGAALLYGTAGSTNLGEIGAYLARSVGSADAGTLGNTAANALTAGAVGINGGRTPTELLLVPYAGAMPLAALGVLFVMVALFVKVAAAPFHMWAPDAYTGAPTPISGFLAAVVKGAGFAAIVRFVIVAFHGADVRLGDFGWAPVAAWVAMISMVIGNFTALVQKNVKRMLAYSSVAHAGYLLLGVAGIGYTADSSQASAIVFYVFAYTAATVGAFGVLAHFARRNEEAESFDDLNGLGHRFPLIGLAMALFMLSAAGLPPTAGFVGKFLLFRNALAASATAEHGGTMLLSLATVGILTSVVSAYAYLRVIAHLYMVPATREVRELPSSGARFAVIVCAVVTLLAGILPGRLMKTADSAAQQIEGHPNGAYLVDNGD